MKKIQSPYENSLFTFRFIGDGFDEHGVSIYDFGVALVSFQRLINKTYLLQKNRLEKGAFPDKREREFLALQIGARERKSDAFGLLPLLTDPASVRILTVLAESLFSALVGYKVQDILTRLKKEPDEDKKFYIQSINAEIVNIVGRIDAAGGVGSIEIGAPALNKKPIVFDSSTKEYVNKLKQEEFLGKYQKIKGKLTKLLPNSLIVEIRRPGGSLVKVRMNSKLFDEIRYAKSTYSIIEFGGRPIYPIGSTSSKIYEFEADDAELIFNDKD